MCIRDSCFSAVKVKFFPNCRQKKQNPPCQRLWRVGFVSFCFLVTQLSDALLAETRTRVLLLQFREEARRVFRLSSCVCAQFTEHPELQDVRRSNVTPRQLPVSRKSSCGDSGFKPRRGPGRALSVLLELDSTPVLLAPTWPICNVEVGHEHLPENRYGCRNVAAIQDHRRACLLYTSRCV